MNSSDPFEAIVSAHYEPLYRFAMSLTRAESDAQDLTQQTFYVWATKGHQLRDLSKVKTWLFTTLHREFLLARRRQSRYPHDELDEVSARLPVVSPASANYADSLQALAALAKVDQVYQPAVVLFYLEDCSYNDIAEILEVPVGTVKSRIARGVAQLREILLPGEPARGTPGRSASPEKTHQEILKPACARPAPAHGLDADQGDAEWDLSSTLLQELPGDL